METVSLGSTGADIPLIGLGTSAYTGDAATLRAGIDMGANLIDTAEIYGTEELVGAAIRGVRHGVVLATKVWRTNLRPAQIRAAAKRSLARLDTDYIDLYQVHWPDPTVPIEETIGAMEDLVDAGMVRNIGVCNFTQVELAAALRAARRYPIVSNQVSFSLVDRRARNALLPYCQQQGVTLIAYSPLWRGLSRIQARDRRGALGAVAYAVGKTPAQVALNWCVSNASVVAIPKSSSLAHMEENCGASGWRLDEEQRTALESSIREGRPPYRRQGPAEVALRLKARRILERFGVRGPLPGAST